MLASIRAFSIRLCVCGGGGGGFTYFLHVTNMDNIRMTVVFLQSDNVLTHNLERTRFFFFFLYIRRHYLNAIDLSETSPFFSCIKRKRSVCIVIRLCGIQYTFGAVVLF